jgi:ribosome recycling factor
MQCLVEKKVLSFTIEEIRRIKMSDMSNVLSEAKERMEKSLDVLKTDLQKIRTGRAHPSILEHIEVDYYGSMTPLTQVANVTAIDARTLSVVPWEKTMNAVVEKVIRDSDLGLNPASVGDQIRVPMPALTEERRKDLVKVVRREAEAAKVAIRNIRRDSNGTLKGLLKDKEISEDDERRSQDEVQKITDKFIVEVDAALASKEKDLLDV